MSTETKEYCPRKSSIDNLISHFQMMLDEATAELEIAKSTEVKNYLKGRKQAFAHAKSVVETYSDIFYKSDKK